MIYLYLYGLSFISSIVQFAKQKEIRLLLGFILIVSIGLVVSFRFESVDYVSALKSAPLQNYDLA